MCFASRKTLYRIIHPFLPLLSLESRTARPAHASRLCCAGSPPKRDITTRKIRPPAPFIALPIVQSPRRQLSAPPPFFSITSSILTVHSIALLVVLQVQHPMPMPMPMPMLTPAKAQSPQSPKEHFSQAKQAKTDETVLAWTAAPPSHILRGAKRSILVLYYY